MRKLLLAIIAIFLISYCKAQPGIDEMQQASHNLSSNFYAALDFAWVLSAILGICGAVRIYHNWQMGRPHIDAAVAAWFFSAFFMLLSGAFLRALYGI